MKTRRIMLAVSVLVGGFMAASVCKLGGGFTPAALALVGLACVPALFHLFVIPGDPALKHRFQVAAMYATVWGVVPFLCLHTAKILPDIGGYIYLGVLLLLWGLGAFLPKWI